MELQKNELLCQYQEYSNWVTTLSNVDDTLWFTPIANGKWSIAEIIAHLTKWDEYIFDHVVPSVKNRRDISFPAFDPYNKQAADYATSGISKEQLLQEAIDARNALVTEYHSLSDDDLHTHILVNDTSHCPYTGVPYHLLYIIKEFVDHDIHHKQQIMKFLEVNNLV